MEQSIVRNGNHFICLEGEWCLIDGPWFDYLEWLSRGGSIPVRLHYHEHGEVQLPTESMELVMSTMKEVEWEPRMWYPAFVNPWRFAALPGLHPLRDRWNEWMARRRRRGYVLLPDGKLPPFLNRSMPEEPKTRGWWYDAWSWYHH